VQVVMLTTDYCQKCAMMKRILGDRVQVERVEDRPDLVAHTAYQELPLFFVMVDGTDVGSFAGMMPLSAFEAKMETYRGVYGDKQALVGS